MHSSISIENLTQAKIKGLSNIMSIGPEYKKKYGLIIPKGNLDLTYYCEQYMTFYRTHCALIGPITRFSHTFYMPERNWSDLNALCCS